MKNNKIIVLGIDPGMTNLGYSIISYDKTTSMSTVLTYGMVTSITLAKKENKCDYKIYGNIIPLMFLERELANIVALYNPDFIASEDAFFNPRTPNAFHSLKLCINAMERALYPLQKTLFKIAPRAAKHCVSTGTADKEAVQFAIRHLPDLKIRKPKTGSIESMTEHEADSIGIGYTFVKTILPDFLINKK